MSLPGRSCVVDWSMSTVRSKTAFACGLARISEHKLGADIGWMAEPAFAGLLGSSVAMYPLHV